VKTANIRVQVFTMKTLKLVLLVTVFVLVNSQIDDKTDFAVFKAIIEILKNHFAGHEPKVDFYFSGPRSETLVNKLLWAKPLGISARVIQLDSFEKSELEFPSILLFDSDERYEQMFSKINWMNRNGVLYNNLVYAPKIGKRDPVATYDDKLFGVFSSYYINIVDDKTINLATSFKYLHEDCHERHFTTINRFSTDTMTWENESFFPEKYQNFNNCPIRVAYNEMSTITSREIFVILAQQFNFHLVKVEVYQGMKESFELEEFLSFIDIANTYKFKFSAVLYTDHLTFTAPAGEPYTQLEKMFLMFDKATWICIGVTLASAFVVIQLVNFMSIQIQKFVFGRDVRTPTLNVASIFLNGSQNRVPGRNFARFLLMMFVVWSLIIRTCYQSELYKNLQQDLRKPRFTTIKELNENNFTLLYSGREGAEINFDEISNKRQV
jgi:hypothetical protein